MRSIPPGVQAVLTSTGGLNRFGEPNYKCAWGEDRFEWIGGLWKDWSPNGTIFLREVFEARYVRRYAPPIFQSERWYVEKWLPPEAYGSPERWAEHTREYFNGSTELALGIYPSRGDWEHIFTVAGPGGSYLAITSTIAHLVVKLNRMSQDMTLGERRKQRIAEEEADDKRRLALVEEWSDNSHITEASPEIKELVLKMARTEGELSRVD